jgi:hypothetical protein
MAYFYPQAALTLGVIWEDFKFSSDAALQKVYTFAVMAKNVTVNINDYMTADTFEAEVDFKMFPFDPRMIRALRVTVHMQDIGHLAPGQAALSSLQRSTANTVFVGFADEESMTFDEDKRTVRIQGRDMTSLLIDRKYTGAPIALTDRVDIAVQNLLNQIPETAHTDKSQGLQVVLRGIKADDLPVLASFMANDGDHQLNGHMNADRHETYWEKIQDIMARASLLCFVELDQLVITTPRTLYDASQARVFVYGSNIKNLSMKRKIGRKKNFNVIVRSLVGKQVIEVKIPLEATAEWCTATGITQGEVKLPEAGPDGSPIDPKDWKPAPYMAFQVRNCKDRDHLIKIAEDIYEEVGRQQLEGSFVTRDMKVLQGTDRSSLVDVLKIRNSTPVQIVIDMGDMRGISSLVLTGKDGNVIGPNVPARRQFLIDRGYEPSVASAFASSMDKFANVFYTKAVKFTLDAENGFEAEIEFLNFIDTKYK